LFGGGSAKNAMMRLKSDAEEEPPEMKRADAPRRARSDGSSGNFEQETAPFRVRSGGSFGSFGQEGAPNRRRWEEGGGGNLAPSPKRDLFGRKKSNNNGKWNGQGGSPGIKRAFDLSGKSMPGGANLFNRSGESSPIRMTSSPMVARTASMLVSSKAEQWLADNL
jgi:hypothetical protein